MAINYADHVEKLNKLHVLARSKQVGYEIVHEEAPDLFYVHVFSSAPGECLITKSWSNLDWCLDVAIEHLDSL